MKKYILLLSIIASCINANSQITENDKKFIATTTNEQKTASSKDILTTFFRASIDNLLGDDKKFTFNSTLYGIDSVFRKKDSEISYKKERWLRQTSINFGLEGDSNSTITKVSGGFTVTLINNKDITLKKFKDVDDKALRHRAILLADIRKAYLNFIAAKYPAKQSDIDTAKAIQYSWTTAASTDDFSNLHPAILEALNSPGLVESVIISSNAGFTKDEIELSILSLLKGKSPLRELFIAIGEKYSRKPLWTFSPNTTYDRISKQGEYSFSSEFTMGIGKDLTKKPWEVELKSKFKIVNDTAIKKTNYESKPFSISIGVNKVLMENSENESKMEFKFFSQYDYQFGNTPVGEKAGIFSLNTTLRINVFKSLWLPFTIKYDIEHSNFLGFLAITANLGN